jgi:F-type H+-transporting ATPase subunit epsilon
VGDGSFDASHRRCVAYNAPRHCALLASRPASKLLVAMVTGVHEVGSNTLKFRLVTPTQVVFEGDAELVIAVTTEGEEGILAAHAPFLAALKPGVLRAILRQAQDTEGASSRLELATSEGFMQALPNRVTVLVDEALRFEEVVVATAREELAAAIERQKTAGADRELFEREQRIIDFANAKLRLTGH